MARSPARRKRLRRALTWPLEAAAVLLIFLLFRALGLNAASRLGGWLARRIGPLTPNHRVAERNLARALPELASEDRAAILRGMWDNLGRTAAEYAYLPRLKLRGEGACLQVEGTEILEALRARGGPAIFIGGHFANWELLPMTAIAWGIPLTTVYRAIENPVVDALVRRLRGARGRRLLPKGLAGAKAALAELRHGGFLGLLIDQKMNDGIAVPLFGRPAMTAPAVAELALRYRCPVIPARIERLEGPRFRVTVMAPLPLPDSGDRRADVLALMTRINRLVEDWIRARPEQWLWVHRRWPD